ncbi:PREDICTED: uncharacterized protein LOC105557150 [Vollenhovia emeryi]|uniref:uncharacterized protein LOC105557150 n=1 Tax=Vollenhovia emeryi TaxID=411798 RepID=UPI0005F37812|nr:PREDICTED: uncharacterized protein LOC105557150 [Vollenhovia emeryi]
MATECPRTLRICAVPPSTAMSTTQENESVVRNTDDQHGVSPDGLLGIGYPEELTVLLKGKGTSDGDNGGASALSAHEEGGSTAEMLSCEGSNEEDPLRVPSSAVEEAAASGDIGHLPGISFGALEGSTRLVADAPAKRKRDSSESPGAASLAAISSESEPGVRGRRTRPRAISDDPPSEGGSSGDRPDDGVIVVSSEERPDWNTTQSESESRPDLGSPGSGILKQVMKSEEALASHSADEITRMAKAWLRGIESARTTSQNIKGTLSGRMGNRIKALENVIKVFSERVEDSGDVPFLRRRNEELEEQLKKAKNSEDQLKKELEESRKRTTKINAELNALRERIGSKSTSREDNVATASARERLSVAGEGPRAPGKRGAKSRALAEASASTDVGDSAMDIKRLEGYEDKLTNEIGNLLHIQEDIAALKERLLNDGPPQPPPPRKKGVPRIMEDIQIRPPLKANRPALSTDSEIVVSTDNQNSRSYRTALLRHKTEETGGPAPRGEVAAPSPAMGKRSRGRKRDTPRKEGPGADAKRGDGPPRRRVPRSAAVTLRSATGEISNTELLRRARQKMSLGDFGIVKPRIRVAAGGALIIEVPGEDGPAKADALAARLRDTLGPDAVVSRPVAKGELRVAGFDGSVSPDELVAALVDAGGCSSRDVKVGSFRESPSGLCSAWVQCPLAAANRMAKAGSIIVGWTMAKVTLLRSRPVQCYRCWDFGHVRGGCRSTIERGRACFNCGGEGHALKECSSPSCCVVCRDKGLNPDHRLGTDNCPSVRPRDRRAGPPGRTNGP